MRQIFMYTLSTCSHCKSVKKLLDDKEIQYNFSDVDLLSGEEKQKALSDLRKYNIRCSFPTVVINEETVIIGFKENEIIEALK
jgi:glutaredoxin-like protein NrdH